MTKISQQTSWIPPNNNCEIVKQKYENNKIDLRKTAIERNVDSEFIDLQLAMSDEEIKKMHQNGLLGAIAPHNDYWNDMFSETYHPVSEWQGPSGLSWINT